ALGTIDPALCDTPVPEGGRIWDLRGVRLMAKRALNVNTWLVGDTTLRNSFLEFREYLGVPFFTYEGNAAGRLRVGYVGDPQNPQPDEGLRVTGRFEVGGPPLDETAKGPTVELEKLVVDNGAEFILSDGVNVRIGDYVEPTNHSVPAAATFENEASLRYGQRLGSALTNQPITTFEVSNQYDAPRQPALWFKGNSYIAKSSDLEPCSETPSEEMELVLRTHLDIEGVLSRSPAIAWNTGDVDLRLLAPVNSGNYDCSDESTCHAEIEVIAADSCNIWFTDVCYRRCLKHWRKLFIDVVAGEKVPTRFVDRHDNHQPNSGGCNDPLPPEAMYVEGDVEINDNANPLQPFVDLNGLKLYYGGALVGDANTGFHNGELIPLIKTEWGDFNGDCVVDADDEALFPLRGTWGPVVPRISATNPLHDFDGDCDVDEVEYDLFYERKNAGYVAQNCMAEPQPTLNCPDVFRGLPTDGGPFGYPAPLSPGLAELFCVPQTTDAMALLITGDSSNPDVECVSLYVQPDGRLDTNSVYRFSSEWSQVWITDEEIIPSSQYYIQAEYAPGLLSMASPFTTALWGDTTGDNFVDVDDLICMLSAFGNTFFESCTLQSADISPCQTDHIVDVDDLVLFLGAFANEPYPCQSPCP
ncbi:MAG: hypothetical protein AABZ47_17410, partial [Planctomycetota bacterium]